MKKVDYIDEEKKYMQVAIKLAEKGAGHVSPNPLVGCVIVKNGRIISSGYHKYCGGHHAEIEALKNCQNPKDATMYVNMEPCCHYNKKTPPCVPKIINAGIKKVVIAMKDPNPFVSCKGIKQLEKHNIKCKVGILKEEAKKLNEIYIKYVTKKIPYVIVKMAYSADGKTKTISSDSKWISSISSRRIVHQIRSINDAVLVGINTVLRDNPSLTSHDMGKNPIRIIIDTDLKIPLNSNVINNEATTIIATSVNSNKSKKEKLKKMRVKILELPVKNNLINIKKLLIELGKIGISSLVIEGGETIVESFFSEKLVDKIMFFICPKIIGKAQNMEDVISVKNISINKIENDLVYEGYIDV
ncbi:MAG: bifunctional diaminohydroxyphosphoribosylaminopyrimidine deaminase/5-amino-6-(5-phosphoribosylamino)uracil reductase RibD [Elusimicrobia bacterium]|nr:bifunctional diaminohydroxyphosphoribosylaminopyrimidine deaminase/5-amino-6-(5-phosphoribosylamino)uracil reductase RibD [Elusimicrobiota bacterium]